MQAAGRRKMPRPAVGVRPSASFYAPAVPRGLRLCGGGFGGTPSIFVTVAARGARLSFTTSIFSRCPH